MFSKINILFIKASFNIKNLSVLHILSHSFDKMHFLLENGLLRDQQSFCQYLKALVGGWSQIASLKVFSSAIVITCNTAASLPNFLFFFYLLPHGTRDRKGNTSRAGNSTQVKRSDRSIA